MHERYSNRKRYFKEQDYTTNKFVIPYIEKRKTIVEGLRVLEIGCGEAGNLMPFLDRGCICVGVDKLPSKIKNGLNFLSDHPLKKNLTLVVSDIYDWISSEPFDIIILRDTLEHIYNQKNFLDYTKQFLKADGIFFIAFAPWQSPFGGHQQICQNSFLCNLPYFHLLPYSLYLYLIRIGNKDQETINELIEIRETRISLDTFLKLLKSTNYRIIHKQLYLFNPNYEIKFKLKPRKQILGFMPWLRNYITTAGYFLIQKEETIIPIDS